MSNIPTSFWRLVAFASPAYIAGAILFPTSSIIPTFYAKQFGLSLAMIGTVLTIGRIFDAVTDPLIGYLSDITKSPIGSRKPWVIGGLFMAMISIYFLYIPRENASILYFATWFLLVYLAFTVLDIPHRAWGTEISREYNERSRISTYMGSAIQLGSLTFAILPLIPIFSSKGYSAETLKFIAVYFIVLMPITGIVSVIFVPEGDPVATERPSVKSIFYSVKGNKPFFTLIGGYVLAGLGNGIFYGLVYLYCDSYLKIGHLFSYILLVDAVATFASLPIWLKILKKYGKHKPWAISISLGGLILLCMIFLKPSNSIFIPFLILIGLRAVLVACTYVVPMAMLGDVIDYDILKTGVNRTANYFAVSTFLSKFNTAFGVGVGFIAIGLLGYTVKGPNSATAIGGFIGTTLVLPAIFLFIATFILWFFPLDHHRQTIIRRRIELRAQRAKRDGLEVS